MPLKYLKIHLIAFMWDSFGLNWYRAQYHTVKIITGLLAVKYTRLSIIPRYLFSNEMLKIFIDSGGWTNGSITNGSITRSNGFNAKFLYSLIGIFWLAYESAFTGVYLKSTKDPFSSNLQIDSLVAPKKIWST